MECKNCGAVAPEEAKYCPNCGTRVDNKKDCYRCGKTNENDFKFCVYCGERIDGKSVCGHCGLEYEGKFCPNCGTKKGQLVPKGKKRKEELTAESKTSAGKEIGGDTYQKAIKATSFFSGLFAAAMALLFVFFISFEGRSSIFYYFVDVFKDAKVVKVLGGQYYSDAVNGLIYTSALFSCLIALATLGGVITFAVFTGIRTVKMFYGVETESPTKTAILTALCYILGTALLYPFDAMKGNGERFGFNGATVVGLVFVSLGLGVKFACKLVKDLRQFKDKWFLVRLICMISCIVMGTVAFLLIRQAGLKLINIGASPSSIALGLLSVLTEIFGDPNYSGLSSEMSAISVLGVFGTLFVLGAIVCALFALFINFRNFDTEEKYKSGMLWSILASVCTIGVMIFSIVLKHQAESILKTDGVDKVFSMKVNVVPSILALIFAVLSLGTVVAAKIVEKKFSKENVETTEKTESAETAEDVVAEVSEEEACVVCDETVTNEAQPTEEV